MTGASLRVDRQPRSPDTGSRLTFGLVVILGLLLCACDNAPKAEMGGPASSSSVATSTPAAQHSFSAILRMTIDGKPWQADQAIEAMVDPPTMTSTILINGSLGPKDAKEQVFSLILIGLDGAGPIHLQSDAPARGVAQIGNLSPDRYLAGSILGYDMQVEVTQYAKVPVLIEARFSGTLTANDGTKLTLGDGYFRYAE